MRSQSRNQDVYWRKAFRDTNKWAKWETPELYVVYSYRDDWPLFVYDAPNETWYENEDRFSRTTSKHRSQCFPIGATAPETEKVSVGWLNGFIQHHTLCDVPF